MNTRAPALRVLLLLLIALAWPGESALARTTIKIATVVPDGTSWMTDMRAGTKEIEQRTDGRVTFKIYAGGVQGTDNQVRRKMRIGQLHGGAFVNTALRDFQKDAEIYGLPMLFRDYDEVRYVRERLDERLMERMREAGYESFGFAGGGFAYLVSSTAIADREDMRGLKVWIPEGSRVARDASRALGIAPVTLPATDVLTGLQTELIDTVMGPPVGIIVMQWHTAMTHVTELPIAYSYAMLLIDRRVFGKLSDEDQAVVTEVMRGVYEGFDRRGEAEDREAHQALLDDGLASVTVSSEERGEWKRLIDESNRKAGAAGEFDLALLEEIECHLEAFRNGGDGLRCGP
jgi:TRAP-type C4-dicarboxylate transport system substrate-binding protein